MRKAIHIYTFYTDDGQYKLLQLNQSTSGLLD